MSKTIITNVRQRNISDISSTTKVQLQYQKFSDEVKTNANVLFTFRNFLISEKPFSLFSTIWTNLSYVLNICGSCELARSQDELRDKSL